MLHKVVKTILAPLAVAPILCWAQAAPVRDPAAITAVWHAIADLPAGGTQ